MIKPIEFLPGIFRGAQPVNIEDWQLLAKLGIKYTLDLQTGANLLADGSPLQEMLTSARYGIATYSHPLGEILPPTQAELSLAESFVVTRDGPVYIHCKAGVDRTGMVAAYLRIHSAKPGLSLPKSIAVSDMKRHGMHLWYYWWSWFL